ncbi:hypothetical protein [Saccharothrix sp. ST-888]|uniref:hypothetical protein n=1 Tax=Saccharothrix sp. ST-888 TaxID=1427391 RepID=UPI0005EBF7C7|nr:hypothetical protein [Saccharothrix sp. ST-888]KJK56091.1 hypothetical protein UK12_24780 [Saccharothrix sp. ST-888]
MPSLRELIADGIEQGTFRALLVADALQWRSHRSDYAISAVVRYAVEEDLADEVDGILTDEEFRELRLARFGPLALREDLNLGSEYFSRDRPDLLRYTRLLFQQRSAERDDEYARLHRRHCQAFADFLQLDVPAAERREIGLDRALRRLFPMRLTPVGEDTEPPVQVDLTEYQLGTWACSCGAREGHAARYDFACGCGAESGNGRLSPGRRRCHRCGTTAEYVTCDQCGTRVTLSLWSQIRQGGVHPSACRLPLVLDLRIQRPWQPATSSSLELMQLPLMLGLAERDDELVFDLPDMLWIDGARDQHGQERPTGQLVSLADHPRYDQQTDVMRILEAAFRRTFTGRGHPAGYSLEPVVAALAGIRLPGRRPRSVDFSGRFARKLGYGLAAEQHEDAGLVRGADMSRPCVVAVSPDLRGDAALVSRALSAPGTLTSPGLDNVSVSLRITQLGPDELTAEPPRVPPARCKALASDGIVLPGEMVEPGDLLVGISAPPVRERDLTQEERLLRAIFGEKPPERQDASLRWIGRQPARVLSVHIGIAWDEDYGIAEHPARVIRSEELPRGEGARISISLATPDPLETGDLLHGPGESHAVVCGTHDGSGADILVGPEHQWANDDSTRIVEVRLHPDDRTRSVVRARSTGAYSTVKQLPVQTSEHDSGQPVRLADLAWLLGHGAPQAAFEIYALRADCIDGRLHLYRLLARGKDSLREIPMTPSGNRSPLESSPSEAVRGWDRLLRSACVEPVRNGDQLSFQPLDDDEVLAASSGEVQRPDILDPHTWLPLPGGLACQRIFGPIRDHECGCGRLRTTRHEGEICQRCGVEVTVSRVRRRRMGHIELAAPMVHPWYRDSLSRTLGLDQGMLAGIVHGRCYVLRDSGLDQFVPLPAAADPRLDVDQLLTGAGAVRFLAARLGRKPARGALLRRLPVLPADLRPMVAFNGRTHSNTLNDRYVEIVKCNSRLRRLTGLGATPKVIHQERAALQQAVDALLDPREGRAPLVNLAMILPGRSGGFRQRLFDRPVDYSARTTIVATPTGDLDTALLPDRLAWLLLKPVIMGRLVNSGDSQNVKAARRDVENRTPQAWAHLQAACQDATVLVSVPDTRWPLFAVHVGLTADLSLKLDPALFDHLGWHRLGTPARIFPVLTAEAAAEIRATLLPSTLLRDTGLTEPTCPPPSLLTLGLQHLPEEIVRMIETGESARLGDLDRFLLFPE